MNAKLKEAEEREFYAKADQRRSPHGAKGHGSPNQKSKADNRDPKTESSRDNRSTTADYFISTIVKSSPQKTVMLVQNLTGKEEPQYKLVTEIIPNKEDMQEIFAFVQGGHIESIDFEAKVERDSKSLQQRGKSSGYKKNKHEDDSFPMHHYTKEVITEGNYDNSFEEWIFDPIISSKSEYKETMTKARKEKIEREMKKQQFEEKIKKVKPTDTFYMLNKRRLNLEPESDKQKTSHHDLHFQPKKDALPSKKIVLKDIGTFTDHLEYPVQPGLETSVNKNSGEENKNIEKPLKEGNLDIKQSAKGGAVPRNDDYMAGMEDPDSRSNSINPKMKKKEMQNLQISDINELYQEQYRLSHDGIPPKRTLDQKEVAPPPVERKEPEVKTGQSTKLQQPTPKTEKDGSQQPVVDKQVTEERTKPPLPESDDSKVHNSLATDKKTESKPTTSPTDKAPVSSEAVGKEAKEEAKPSVNNSKEEASKPLDKDKDSSKIAETKSATTMGRIPLPPSKKNVETKPADPKTEAKVEEKEPGSKPKVNISIEKPAEAKPMPGTTPPNPPESEAPLPKLSQNPFLAKQSAVKSPSPPPKTKPDAKPEAKPLATESTLSPEKPKESQAGTMPPKSPRNISEVDNKISGLRSLWK